jgi:hypothetical protein
MLTLVACGADSASDSSTHSGAASSTDETPTTQKAAAQKAIVVRGEGALVRPFGAKSLREFAADPYVVGVVRGTVTKVESRADDIGSVNSIVTVSVKHGLGLKAGSTIQVSEPGGVVPMSEVREQFEEKDWEEPLTGDDLARMVDFQMEGFPHSNIGDDMVMFLAEGGGEGVYSLATKLVPRGAGFRFKDDDAPNPAWGTDVSAATVDALVQDAAK